MVSTSDSVIIEFHSDDTVEHKGFVLEYSTTEPAPMYAVKTTPSVRTTHELIVH